MYTAGRYQIDIFRDEDFIRGASDNLHKYDIEHFDESKYEFPTMIGIKVFEDNSLIKNAIIGSIGGATGIHEGSAIVEDDRVLICCCDSIFCLSIPDLTLVWRTQADQATCFEIRKYQDDYIIHGELEISRLDKNGKILWQQSGADIFVTLYGSQGFEMTDQYIIVSDFENRIYKFDYDGNNLTDKTQFNWL